MKTNYALLLGTLLFGSITSGVLAQGPAKGSARSIVIRNVQAVTSVPVTQPGVQVGQSRAHSPRRSAENPFIAQSQQSVSAEMRGGGYCAASAEGSVDFDLDERIVNVSFSNINNASANAAPVAPAYTFYSALTGNVSIGQSYTLSVNVNTNTLTTGWSENQVLAWIDFNQDLDFDDAGEQVLISTIEALDIYSGSVTIPAGAVIGTTRMRIRLHDTHDGSGYINVFNDTPCGVASYGEIEDYVLNITSGGGGSGNDDCANVLPSALAAGGSVTFTGDNSSAVPGGDGDLDVGGDTTTVWHAITTTECTNITLAFCGTATPPSNYWAALFGACPADNNYILYSNFDFLACGDDNLTLFFYDVPAGTYYVPVRGEPTTAGPYVVTLDAAACATSGAYCTAGAVSTQFEKISNVTTAGINNNSTSTAGYEDFTAGTAGSMTAGGSFPVSVTISGGYATDEVRIWIDFDQSDSFEGGELVFASALGVGPHAGTINVPAGAAVGATRMRVRLHDTYVGVDYPNTPNPTPCDTSTYGQVEDYAINISGGGPTPINDLCGNSTPVSLSVGGNVTFAGDNTNATNIGDYVPGGTFDPMDPTVWHSFTTTECSNVVVSYCNTNPGFDPVWIFLTNDCPVGDSYVLGAYENTTCAPNYTISYFNLPAGTWYLPVLMDPVGAIGPYSIALSATACASPGDYCTAGAVSLQFEKISNVTFADVNNNSTSAAGFEDFTSLTASVVGGQSYPISVTISGGYATDQVLAWIDWDHNSIFDAGELMYASANGVGPHTGTINVPLTAVAGPTRMRVRLHDTYALGVDYPNTPNPTPCDTSTYGQVEDYTVDMIGIITGVQENGAAAWSVFPNPGNGDISIRYAGENTKVTVEVLDMTGRMVHSELRQFTTGTTEQFGLAEKLATGTYVLRFTTDNGRDEQRIVIR